ncbi:MAG: STAS domain-containing protein [Halorhodospira halophila]|uniref:STAS domain-containing protein n=1 Tax=Halorhodospira TaxID=85108 RepID=UPI001914A445|nr:MULTISPECIES: STAS domain-containing protein [Halorhodospira]MBK5936665.1 hypothetical protein [Halorhodospira halophila]MBK5944479.1 hypothetical protein [Halorhodospira halophila]MCC3750815.1 STAS domain-containing protein [Halorhodospira halophila]MCG5527400.1 STAS domain-containing protein [Halorhodospira halophila]MCG5532880.1 STAS domain-containing protein [Halorhodospira sp. 9621]
MAAHQHIDLGEQLDITVAATLKETLADALSSGQPVALDGARLQQVDAAGVQLLAAFARAAASRAGWSWQGGGAPAPVTEAAADLGLTDELGPGGAAR